METLLHDQPYLLATIRSAMTHGVAIWLHSHETARLLASQMDMSPGRDLGYTVRYRLTAGVLEVFPHGVAWEDAWRQVLEAECNLEDESVGSQTYRLNSRREQEAARTLLELQTAEVPALPPPQRRSPRLAAKTYARAR